MEESVNFRVEADLSRVRTFRRLRPNSKVSRTLEIASNRVKAD